MKAWDEVQQICEHVLDKAIGISQLEAAKIEEKRTEMAQTWRSENKKRLAEKKLAEKKLAEEKSKKDGSGGTQDKADDPGKNDDGGNIPPAEEYRENEEELQNAFKEARSRRSELDGVYITLASEPLLWSVFIQSALAKENISQ